MVSFENRKNRFAPRRKFSEERKQKQRSILENARERRKDKTHIKPPSFKERLLNLETNNTNTNNTSDDTILKRLSLLESYLSNNDNDEIIPMIDFLELRMDDIEETINKNDNTIIDNTNTNNDNDEIIPMIDFLKIRLDDNDNDNDNIKKQLININTKIDNIISEQSELQTDITEIYKELDDK